MATHSSTLAWKIPWTEEPGRLQSTGSQERLHFTFTHFTIYSTPSIMFDTKQSFLLIVETFCRVHCTK